MITALIYCWWWVKCQCLLVSMNVYRGNFDLLLVLEKKWRTHPDSGFILWELWMSMQNFMQRYAGKLRTLQEKASGAHQKSEFILWGLYIKFHGTSSKSWDLLVWAKVVDRLTFACLFTEKSVSLRHNVIKNDVQKCKCYLLAFVGLDKKGCLLPHR